VLEMEQWWSVLKRVLAFQLTIVLAISMVGCSDRVVASLGEGSGSVTPDQPEMVILEVSPPETLRELGQSLEAYHPQVTIVSPQSDEILEDDTVMVQLQVQDLPIFKNETLGLGPHLHVILDNQPHIPVYDLSDPLVLSDVSPGTHTLRVFAVRPWDESFKNEGAYAQTTFHLYTQSDDNSPESTLPLLTYNHPQGSYGAGPILLDFYLTNAPLHLIAQESEEDDILDWRIRCTINGKSFMIDRWQPIYLTGFKPGKNWVKLEFLDELGNPVKNTFNNTVQVITYEPGGDDTLSKLIRGELSADEARGIVDPNYVAEEEMEEQTPEPPPEVTEEPLTEPVPEVLEEPVTLPETIEEPISLPETIEESISLPETIEEPIVEPEEIPDEIDIPEEMVEPAVEPEGVEEPEPMPEGSREEVLLEAEPEVELISPETVVPGEEESVLEMTPIETEMPLEEEPAPIELSEEGDVTTPEIPNAEAIPTDSEAEDVPATIELEPQLEPIVEEEIDFPAQPEETPQSIEILDEESLTEETN
jgi:hypothetical protein